ncbi:MAG: 50S ribosomal protein L13 [Thermotoga sp. 47_83]|jgi:large subunit ribosomal protein L13|uniref:Large ribosomal subunit protein uL13 n=2 Tax=Thermotoga petrophila TaxID=93929 RepID=D2C3Y8_THEP2|nr:50S ribosomal protein L13 [Thermotoga petrophila]KUK33290.1 MAG: 50S ribosomal protein L13 [Thermotoga sp. 47_83]ADA67442.1 ribosomal protein L13 [Thermotoga petrophila RKU-10]KUK22837.1 MAG: 50S ribosomal protein L13 [Thermotoga petrophila]HAA82760.1 50S ribosomal protein L13 [Thermotoga petrophila]HBT99817.1 50S ribosomal protein L13 [Thermotoga petrophila]
MARYFPVQKTTTIKPEEVERKWYVVDASGKVLGRLATRIAKILMGKHKPNYTPHVDTGDYVIVVNADKVVLTGKKLDQKVYYWHSGYPGGLKSLTARQMLEKHPEKLIWLAVKRMLPKNRQSRKMLKRLKVYASPEHPHQAQKPEPIEL